MTDPDLTKPVDDAARAFWEHVAGKGKEPFDSLSVENKLRMRQIVLPVVQASIVSILEAAGHIGPDGLPKHLPMAVDEEGNGPTLPSEADHFSCWCLDPKCQWTIALKAAGYVARGQECHRTADYLEKIADLTDGPLAPYLATQDRVNARTLRARGDKLLGPYRIDRESYEDGEQQNQEDGKGTEEG